LEELLANDSAKEEKQAPMTAGERLAAQQAAKAARKAAQKGRDAELVEERAIAQAVVAKDWLQENLKPLGLMAAVVLVVAGLGIGWSTYTRGQAIDAGAALGAVVDDQASDSAALAGAYARVAEAHPKTPAAAWARIGEGKTLYAQGDWAGSRAAYQAALDTSDDEVVRWIALEGIAYALEGEASYEEALARLEALREVDPSVAPIAGYHQGRILQAQGKLEEAKTKLRGVLADLKDPEAPELPYTREQTEARLALLDASLAPADGVDPRRADEFIRQMNDLLQQQPSSE
jgi:predicted negative regulator of RcsB-dependent stress response